MTTTKEMIRRGWFAELLDRALRVSPDIETAMQAAEMAFAEMPEPPKEKPKEPPHKPHKIAAAGPIASAGGGGGTGAAANPGDFAPEPSPPRGRGTKRKAGGRARGRRLAKGLRLSKKWRTYKPDGAAFAYEDWQQFKGQRGGIGWKNVRTGEVRYQKQRPDYGIDRPAAQPPQQSGQQQVQQPQQRAAARQQPAQQARQQPSQSAVGTYQQEYVKTTAFIGEQLDRSGLHPVVQAEYGTAAKAVLEKMSATALSRMRANCTKGAYFFQGAKQLNDWFVQHAPQHPLAQKIQQGKTMIAGLYSHSGSNGYLSLDGGKGAGFSKATEEIYSHEFMHAVDGPHNEISESPEWRAAWENEIRNKGVSEHAWKSQSEGLAEFGRLLFVTPNPTTLWKDFPRTMQVLHARGIHEYRNPYAA